MQHLKYYLPGGMLVLTAVLILAVPEILIAMISAMVMVAGFLVLYVGHGLRKSEVALRRTRGRFHASDWHRYCFYR